MLWFGQELAQVDPGLYGGDTRTRSFIRVDDLANGNWWLLVGDDFTPFGFWAKKISGDLANPTSYVEWGGKVYSPPGTPTPEMGSGHFLEQDTKYDAYFRNIQIINNFGQNVEEFNTETFNDIGVYDVADKQNAQNFGHLVLYGGSFAEMAMLLIPHLNKTTSSTPRGSALGD
ncbi:hypothetical protein RHSIM_Rhsim02G0222400 [Rhododendron simsii]|uniref:Neprosin PEP catalytic domain-containing protein n=1 Tax=Rhododendron simsii TaxID=118357 RepID=A0A834LSX4_RHOSS|nr:hypothetical protein RHSIM_Rhsim02G0222400 [Rhododendron simsii]